MFETLRSHLLALVAAYTASTGVNAPSLGKLAINDHNFFRRIEARRGFTVKSFDRAHQWFEANWPAAAEWPGDVPRHLGGRTSHSSIHDTKEHVAL